MFCDEHAVPLRDLMSCKVADFVAVSPTVSGYSRGQATPKNTL